MYKNEEVLESLRCIELLRDDEIAKIVLRNIEAIRESLSKIYKNENVDIEELKSSRVSYYMKKEYDKPDRKETLSWGQGWDDCIDYLTTQGMPIIQTTKPEEPKREHGNTPIATGNKRYRKGFRNKVILQLEFEYTINEPTDQHGCRPPYHGETFTKWRDARFEDITEFKK